MDGQPSRVTTDPVAVVVELVGALEPNLSPAVVEGIITTLAKGRATQRRLAQALSERPGLLTDGRSPAQRVVGDLLIALRQAGGDTHLAAMLCHLWEAPADLPAPWRATGTARCAGRKPCRAAPVEDPRIGFRDRAGEPRCHGCPPDDGADPMEIILAVLAAADPGISAETVTAAVMAVTSRSGQRRQLAWALEDRPELLTGAGGEAAAPFGAALHRCALQQGRDRHRPAACPHCRRVIALSVCVDGVRVCRNCKAKARAVPCGRCGVRREPAIRDGDGRPLCPNCLITDPTNQEICVTCRRRRPVSTRTKDGPLCGTCRPGKTMTCAICGPLGAL